MNGKNRVTTRTSWRQWGSELSGFLFLSTDIIFLFIFNYFFLYWPIFIFRLESDIFPVMAGTIRFGSWQLHFSLIFPYSMTGWIGLQFVRFFRLNPGSSGSLKTHVYPVLYLKNWISIPFPVFPVGPSGPIWISKLWLKWHQLH